jgi:hypothetical protein
MGDPHDDGSGNDARPPTGDDYNYNALLAAVGVFAKALSDTTFADAAMFARAREALGNNELEFDDADVAVSRGEGETGQWVAAWAWLPDEEEQV